MEVNLQVVLLLNSARELSAMVELGVGLQAHTQLDHCAVGARKDAAKRFLNSPERDEKWVAFC